MYGDGGSHDYDHDSYLESLGISVTPLLPVASPNPWGEVLHAPSGALEDEIWAHYPIAPERASPPTSPSTSRPSPFSPCQVLEAATQLASPPTPSTCSLFQCPHSGCESRPPFNSPKLLQNHVRRSHKPRNAVCLVCGKRFVYQTDVRKHHNVNAHTDLPALPAWVPKKQRARIIVHLTN